MLIKHYILATGPPACAIYQRPTKYRHLLRSNNNTSAADRAYIILYNNNNSKYIYVAAHGTFRAHRLVFVRICVCVCVCVCACPSPRISDDDDDDDNNNNLRITHDISVRTVAVFVAGLCC